MSARFLGTEAYSVTEGGSGSRMIQYSTSFSPFSEISFSSCATILSRRAITTLTSSILRRRAWKLGSERSGSKNVCDLMYMGNRRGP
jgi:hypothetical protein